MKIYEEKTYGRQYSTFKYIVHKPIFGLQKLYMIFRNAKLKNTHLRKEVTTFLYKILINVVNPELRKQMI